jgi:hypothetical protein
MLLSSLLTAAALACPQDDAAQKLSASLSKTAETGGIRFKGRSSNSSSGDPILSQLGGLGMAFFEGAFGATVDPAGFRRIDIDGASGRTEIYERDGRIVKKQVWQGDRLNVDGFADEIVQLLDIKRIAEHAAKSKLAAVEKDSGGRKVLEVTGKLPTSLIRQKEDAGDMMKAYTRFQVDELNVTAEIDPESGLLRRIEFKLGKSNAMMDLIRRQLGQEEHEGPDLVLSYSFEVEKVEAGLKPDVPADVLKRFEE